MKISASLAEIQRSAALTLVLINYNATQHRCVSIDIVSNFFRFQDRLPFRLRSFVVYKFSCRCCQASYIDKICRLFHIRISKYMGISALTGKALSHTQRSQVS